MNADEPIAVSYLAEGDIVKPRVVWPGLRQDIGRILRIERRGTAHCYVVEYPDGQTQGFSWWMLEKVRGV